MSVSVNFIFIFSRSVLIWILLFSFSTQAQNNQQTAKSLLFFDKANALADTTINIQEVLVKAFQSDKRLQDTPGSINLITNRQLLREPAFTLAPTVNKIPGVWMQNGSLNTNRLTIRGIGTRSPYGSNKIRAYYGDIPLTNGVGETTLEDLDMEQISNIEIIKGPSSGFYGSGLGGVLLFNPTQPTRDQFVQQVSVGSFQTIKYTGKLLVVGKQSGHSLTYNQIHSAGYRENNETNRQNLTWTTSFSKNRTQINLLAAFIYLDAFIPSSIDFNTFQETPEKAAANWATAKGYETYHKAFGGISVVQNFDRNWQAKISVFGQTNRNNELRPFNILQEENNFEGMRSVIEKKYTSDKLTSRFILGDEFFSENYRWKTLQNKSRIAGNLLTDNDENRWYNNVFLLADFEYHRKLFVSASLNLNQTNYSYRDLFLTDGDKSDNQHFKPVISPRLAINWKAIDRISIFTVASHGFSPPTLEETLIPGGLRNTNIKPETGWNMELGAKGAVTEKLFFELSAYYMRVKNLLVAHRTSEDEYMGVNAGATNHPGIEMKVDYQLVNRAQWSSFFRANAHFTRYSFAEFVDRENDYSGNKLTGHPSTVTNWMLETSHATGFFLNLHFQTVGRMPIRDDNSLFTDSYQLANLMAGYEKSFKKLSVSISSGVQNIFDERYASMVLINATAVGNQSPRYYYPGLPVNYKTMLNLRYSF
jgi:iron complex outermembrane receptor protein